jgi:hypothetical protein
MKKSILIALFGAASVAVSYGQGTILFGNYSSSSQTTGITYGNGPAVGLGAGPEISATLLYGASTDTAISQLTAIGSPVALGEGVATQPGVIGGGSYAGWFGLVSVTIDASHPGTEYAFAIEATGTYLGNVYTGYSGIDYGVTQSGGNPNPTLPNSLLNGSFTVNEVVPVPEPSSLALAGLGGFGMLMAFRRKKA